MQSCSTRSLWTGQETQHDLGKWHQNLWGMWELQQSNRTYNHWSSFLFVGRDDQKLCSYLFWNEILCPFPDYTNEYHLGAMSMYSVLMAQLCCCMWVNSVPSLYWAGLLSGPTIRQICWKANAPSRNRTFSRWYHTHWWKVAKGLSSLAEGHQRSTAQQVVLVVKIKQAKTKK